MFRHYFDASLITFFSQIAGDMQHRDISPEGLAVNAHLLIDVFKELRRTLLHNVMDTQPRLQVLQETLHEAYKVLCCADIPWDSLCSDITQNTSIIKKEALVGKYNIYIEHLYFL